MQASSKSGNGTDEVILAGAESDDKAVEENVDDVLMKNR